MTPEGEQVLRDALELAPCDRAELVEQILASFEFPARKDVDVAWAREAEARIDAYERGEIETAPAGDVFKDIDRRTQGRECTIGH